MRAVIWGTRGSIPCPGPEWSRYGGNTSCVAVHGPDPSALVVLDAGTGVIGLGQHLPPEVRRVDLFLSHLHMDHILGLGFFAALFDPAMEVHLWGPSSSTTDLRGRLGRYLSPPLFPVRLRELPCALEVHDLPVGDVEVPGLTVTSALVCHPGSAVGYRIGDGRSTVAYLSDHEPALGVVGFPQAPEWTSGHALAAGADLLVHDAQYSEAEYPAKAGWGHSAIEHAIAFAAHASVGRLVAFHHDPAHDDEWMDAYYAALGPTSVPVTAAREGDEFEL